MGRVALYQHYSRTCGSIAQRVVKAWKLAVSAQDQKKHDTQKYPVLDSKKINGISHS